MLPLAYEWLPVWVKVSLQTRAQSQGDRFKRLIKTFGPLKAIINVLAPNNYGILLLRNWPLITEVLVNVMAHINYYYYVINTYLSSYIVVQVFIVINLTSTLFPSDNKCLVKVVTAAYYNM